MIRYFVRGLLPLFIFLVFSFIITSNIQSFDETDILIGSIICFVSNIIASVIFGYKKKISDDRVERINKNIHNGVWRKTMIHL